MKKINEKIIIIVGIILFAIIIMCVVLLQGNKKSNEGESSSNIADMIMTTESDRASIDSTSKEETSKQMAESNQDTLESSSENETKEGIIGTSSEDKTNQNIETDSNIEITEEEIKESTKEEFTTSGNVGVIEKKEATYEEWLAAGMVIATSMQYMDFEIIDIYLASETKLSERQESLGVYMVFASEGQLFVIHSVPLSEERSEAGTTDLYTKDLGFASFDTMSNEVLENVDTSVLKSVNVDDLGELISQSMLVSLYER